MSNRITFLKVGFVESKKTMKKKGEFQIVEGGMGGET